MSEATPDPYAELLADIAWAEQALAEAEDEMHEAQRLAASLKALLRKRKAMDASP